MKRILHLFSQPTQDPSPGSRAESTQFCHRFGCLIRPVIYYISVAICALALGPVADAGVGCVLHKSTDCSADLDWDGVVLDNVIIHVAPGVPGGRYSAGLQAINSAGLAGNYEMAVVNVNPDGSWTGGYSGGGVNSMGTESMAGLSIASLRCLTSPSPLRATCLLMLGYHAMATASATLSTGRSRSQSAARRCRLQLRRPPPVQMTRTTTPNRAGTSAKDRLLLWRATAFIRCWLA
jgi:hypothetical protein